VLEPAWLTVQIYQTCTWEKFLPFGAERFHFDGISAREIREACTLHQAPPEEWALIAKRIKQHMVPAARAEFNKKR